VAPLSDNDRPADDLPSLEALYERYGTRVLNLIHRMTGNEEIARDLAQDVWLRVHGHLDHFEARADIFTWIYRIAVNLTLNHLKREKRRHWIDLLDLSVGEVLCDESEDLVAPKPASPERPDRALESDERARRLWEAVQSLDPKYRVPIVLFHYEDQSYQQIADAMGLSMVAVQARIFRGRKQLAKILGPLLDQL
jgi:RNA polymerase sigma-70 factor (ECF subfamily)